MCHFKEYFSGPVIRNPTDNSNGYQGCGHIYLMVREKSCLDWTIYRGNCRSCKITFEEDLTNLSEPLSRGQYSNAEVQTGPKCWVPGCWNAHPMTLDPEARIHGWGSGLGYTWMDVRMQGRYQGPLPPGEANDSVAIWSGIESRWMQRLLYMGYQLGKKVILEHIPAGFTILEHEPNCSPSENRVALTWQTDTFDTFAAQESLLWAMRALYQSWVTQIAAERAQALLQCPYICQAANVLPRHAKPYCAGAFGLHPACPCNNHGRVLEQ